MKRIHWSKIIKITLGCCLAFALAEAWGLHYTTSVVTITLLSIFNTRRDTFQVAWKRTQAFFLAALVGFFFFSMLHYSVAALAGYLLVYGLLCHALGLLDGFSMSTVLMLHLWKDQVFTVPAFSNELALMAIGISMGILMNLYMPDRIWRIQQAQQVIEDTMRAILFSLADALDGKDTEAETKILLKELNQMLELTLVDASYTEGNGIFRDTGYYADYVRMRMEQWGLLKQLSDHLPRLQEPVAQNSLVSGFIRETARSLHEYNNAVDLLESLNQRKTQFHQMPLPATRMEFESRAVLYEIVYELQQLLTLKQEFAVQLTRKQIKHFWSPDGNRHPAP